MKEKNMTGSLPNSIRSDFPVLKDLIYLDNAATSLSPTQVIAAQVEAEQFYRANVGRGIHRLSRMATHKYQDARENLKTFLGGEKGMLIFTKNTTEAVNIVSQGVSWKKSDRVITAIHEHHSNLLPWYRLAAQGRISGVDVVNSTNGTLDPSKIQNLITKDTRMLALGHASNVFGTVAQVKELAKICEEHDILFLLDGAQTAPHLPLNLDTLGCDFFCFSGHKMLGPMGIGGLWIGDKTDKADYPEPLFAGGGMVLEVFDKTYEPKSGHEQYEAGTPNVIGAIGLSAAADYLTNIGMKHVKLHSESLAKRMIDGLSEIYGVHVLTPKNVPLIGTVSFTVDKVHPHEVAYLLDEAAGIMVRSGEHCCQPLMKSLGLKGTVRASSYCYNSEEDIDMLVATVEEISGMVT